MPLNRYCLVASVYPEGGLATAVIEILEHEDAADACIRAQKKPVYLETGDTYPSLTAFESDLGKLAKDTADTEAPFTYQFLRSRVKESSVPNSGPIGIRLYEARTTRDLLTQKFGFFERGERLTY